MQQGLSELKDVPDVYGCFLAGNSGQVLEVDPPLEITRGELEAISLHVIQVLLGLATWGDSVREVDFIYHESRLVVRDLERAALVMICRPEVDISLLRLTLNVVTNRWAEDPAVQEKLDESGEERDVELPDLFADRVEAEGEESFFA